MRAQVFRLLKNHKLQDLLDPLASWRRQRHSGKVELQKMGFSLWNLFKAGLLMLNSVMILNRRRFLAKYGLDDTSAMHNTGGSPITGQIVGLLHAVQYLKVPVIIANTIVIVFEIILGGT